MKGIQFVEFQKEYWSRAKFYAFLPVHLLLEVLLQQDRVHLLLMAPFRNIKFGSRLSCHFWRNLFGKFCLRRDLLFLAWERIWHPWPEMWNAFLLGTCPWFWRLWQVLVGASDEILTLKLVLLWTCLPLKGLKICRHRQTVLLVWTSIPAWSKPCLGQGLVIYPSVLRLHFDLRLLCCSVLQESLFPVRVLKIYADCINLKIWLTVCLFWWSQQGFCGYKAKDVTLNNVINLEGL